MKVYFDNVIASGEELRDLRPAEMEAVLQLREIASVSDLDLVTSRETWREQDRTRDPEKRERLARSRERLTIVTDDHRLLGFNIQQDRYTFISSPMLTEIVDEQLFSGLRAAGLKEADARHLMYAVHNGCARFVTTDPDFIDRRGVLEPLCRGLRIVMPTELLAELS